MPNLNDTEIKNKVFLGDCREILKSFSENQIAACITDPPYNYEFIGAEWNHDEADRRIRHAANGSTLVKNIPYGSGLAGGVRNQRWYERNHKNILDYEKWCYSWATELFRICKPGAVVAVFNSTRTVAHVQVALERAGFYARDILVYRRSSGIPKGYNAEQQLKRKGHPNYEDWRGWHSCFRSEWEAIAILQKPLANNYTETVTQYDVGLFYTQREDGGFQSNIIEGISRDTKEDFNIHCTVKPLALMQKLVEILMPNIDGNIVLDPFAGSGTTLVAAKSLNVDYCGIEIVPEYLEVINKRLEHNTTDKQLDLLNTGR